MRLRNKFMCAALVAVAALAAACTGEIEDDGDAPVDSLPLNDVFETAATEANVPAVLLKAISYAETRWEMVQGDDHGGVNPAFGLMALRGANIARGAALAGVDELDVENDELSNVRAAALILSGLADDAGIDRADLAAWAKVVGTYSGIEDDDARRAYVVDTVYRVIQTGVELVDEAGMTVASIEPTDVRPDYPIPELLQASTADYRAAIWRPSPNYNSRPSGSTGRPRMVIIHTCEGGYAGCWGWLRNTRAGASAHYVVSEGGGEITQLVRESKRAWHIAATYSSSRNGGRESGLNGVSSNHFTIGIEHAGYARQASFRSGQIEASAKLVCDITRDHSIARDKYHIVGHGQLQPWNRTDPGRNWPWTHYLNRVRAHCGSGGGGGGGTTTGGSFVVDSNNARNNRSKGYIQVSSTWRSSASTSGYYGTGYWWASTQPVSDGASFFFYMPSAGNKTIDAWWTVGSNRSTRAAFVAFDASGRKLGTATRSQQKNGRRWNKLGTWRFTKGWNKIVLSRWTSENKVVIADAIRVR